MVIDQKLQQLSLEHHYVKTNGVTLHVVQAGPVDGPLVILLHGFPEYWGGWHHQIPYLVQRGYRVWAPDQRGYGFSDKPRDLDAYRLEVLAKDVCGLIEAAGEERAFVVGHDWGAFVAWWTAVLFPEKVRRLAILNVPHPGAVNRLVRQERNVEQMVRSWYIAFFQLPWLPERLLGAGGGQVLARMVQETARSTTFSAAEMDAYRRVWRQPEALRGMLAWYRALLQRGFLVPDDVQVHVPTLIIWGEKDTALSIELPRLSLDFCDDAQLYIIEGATHWVQHDEPARVNYLLQDFFAMDEGMG